MYKNYTIHCCGGLTEKEILIIKNSSSFISDQILKQKSSCNPHYLLSKANPYSVLQQKSILNHLQLVNQIRFNQPKDYFPKYNSLVALQEL